MVNLVPGDDEDEAANKKRDESSSSSSLLSAHRDADAAAKRTKKEWLAYRGVKHTRVGNDFQCAILPSAGSNNDNDNDNDEQGNVDKESKAQESKETK
jgi:hypothetical protein